MRCFSTLVMLIWQPKQLASPTRTTLGIFTDFATSHLFSNSFFKICKVTAFTVRAVGVKARGSWLRPTTKARLERQMCVLWKLPFHYMEPWMFLASQ